MAARMVTYIAGVGYRPGARERLAKIIPGEWLTLKLEPENPYDPKAVAVYDGDMHLGYVPAADAPAVGKAMRDGYLVEACYSGVVAPTEIVITWEVQNG
jgi:hypothetical protein